MLPRRALPRPPRAFVRAAAPLTVALALSAAAAALAEDVVGPPIRAGGYRAEIRDDDEHGTDLDEYRALLVAGERLSVKVGAVKFSGFIPSLEIVGPDGVVRPAKIRLIGVGRTIAVDAFPVDSTGLWTVRIGARLGSQGRYDVSFRVAPAPDVVAEIPAGTAGPFALPFDALDGTALSVDVSGRKAPSSIISLTDPAGAEVTDDGGGSAASAAKTRKRRTTLQVSPLAAGSGTYNLALDLPEDHGGTTVTVRARRPALAKGRRTLAATEPFLETRSFLLEGVHDLPVRLKGRYFSSNVPPTVLFGDVPGTDVRVDTFGTQIDVNPPVLPEGSLVRVVVVNADGQAFERPDYFFYVPSPTLVAVTARDGTPAAGASTAGGRIVRLHGTEFRSGLFARFGGVGVYPQILSADEAECAVPPHAAGVVDVSIEDAYLHEAVLEGAFEYKPAPAPGASPFAPAAVAAESATTLDVRGSGFEEEDVVLVGGAPVATQWFSGSLLRCTVPAGPDARLQIAVVDRVGTVVAFPDLRRKPAPTITSVRATGGSYRGTNEVAIAGGTVVTVAGAGVDVTDTFSAGGAPATVLGPTAGGVEWVLPAGAAGNASVTLTDALGRSATKALAVRFVGYVDASAASAPAVSTVDDFSALRLLCTDLDNDAAADDLLVASTTSAPGSRTVKTRLLTGGTGATAGVLADRTATQFPAKGADASGLDDWASRAIAAADLDGVAGTDLLVGGPSPAKTTQGDVRAFVNGGTGTFSYSASRSVGTTYAAKVDARDETNVVHSVTGVRNVQGSPQVIALLDVTGDGRPDLLVGRDREESTYAGIDPAYVNFATNPPSVTAANAAARVINETRYHAALQVWENRLATNGGWVDVSSTRLPSAGTDANDTVPAYPARDIATADIDRDGDTDVLLTWDDPTTTTASGLTHGTRFDAARIATRVLLNNGSGVFSDATATWMPPAASPEFWQAHRLVLRDLDADGYADLVLVHAEGVDAWLGVPLHNRTALRVLRNTGTSFSDVTATALPPLPGFSTDDYRGSALWVGDADSDGVSDILVSTPATLRTTAGTRLRSAHLFLGNTGSLSFRAGTDFLPAPATDGGEADDLALSALLGTADPALILTTETKPQVSAGGRYLRVFEWKR